MVPSSQSRCLVTSAVFHGVVLTAAVMLSAFTPASVPPPSADLHYITVLPSTQLSAETTSGGSSATSTTPTAPAPAPPSPQTLNPPPPKAVEQAPPKLPPKVVVPPAPPVAVQTPIKPPKAEVVQRPKLSDTRVVNPVVKPQDVEKERPAPRPPKTINLANTPVVPTGVDSAKVRQRAEDAARLAEERAEARRQAQREAADAKARADWEAAQAARRAALNQTLNGLGKAIAGPMKIELPGPGGGGAVVLSYADYVQTVFQAAWNRNRPATLAAKSARSRVSLVIRRDGVFTYQVLTPSRVNEVDAAIGRILKQQGPLRAFPSDLTREDLEIIITFNLESSASG